MEVPVRWSATDERTALRRIVTLARLENEVLARYWAGPRHAASDFCGAGVVS